MDRQASESGIRKAARGSLWATVGFVGIHLLRLVSNLILTRLVAPEAFGLMTLVNVVLQGLALFSDVGIGPSVIQNKRDDRRFLDTAWTIQGARGLILALVGMLLGVPLARFYEEPALVWLLPFSASSALFAGLRSTKLFTLNRNLDIGRLTAVELTSYVLGAVVTIGWAMVHPTVWALAAGGVLSTAAKASLSQFVLHGPTNRPTWDRDAARALFRFGKWVFVSTLLGFVASQSDRLVFGKLVPTETLGIYGGVAVLIAGTPQQAFRYLALQVNFPLYSRTLRAGGDLAAVFRNSRRRVLLLGGWGISGLIAGGPTAVELLYAPTYAAAGWMVQILALGVWFNVLEATTEAALLARGESGRVATANLAKVIAMALLMPLGWIAWGFPGALFGFSVAEVFRWAFAGLAARPARLGALPQELGFTGLVALNGLIGWTIVETLRGSVVLEAAVLAIALTVLWTPAALVLRRRRRR